MPLGPTEGKMMTRLGRAEAIAKGAGIARRFWKKGAGIARMLMMEIFA